MAMVKAQKMFVHVYIVAIVGRASETAFPRTLASLVHVDSGSD